MAKITLQEKLIKDRVLNRGLVVSYNLIEKMDLAGFVNSRTLSFFLPLICDMDGIVNKESVNQVVCSGFLFQTIKRSPKDCKLDELRNVTPIFPKLQMCDSEVDINIEDLYIPSLLKNNIYKKIKARTGTGVVVTQYEIKHLNNDVESGYTFFERDCKAYLTAKQDDVLLLDKNDRIGSVAEDVVAICRYLHPQSGCLYYSQFGLDELYFEE